MYKPYKFRFYLNIKKLFKIKINKKKLFTAECNIQVCCLQVELKYMWIWLYITLYTIYYNTGEKNCISSVNICLCSVESICNSGHWRILKVCSGGVITKILHVFCDNIERKSNKSLWTYSCNWKTKTCIGHVHTVIYLLNLESVCFNVNTVFYGYAL